MKTKKPKPGKLPNKPSELTRVALRDLSRVERSKAYQVNFGYWHKPDTDIGKCLVCFSGAVIAKTLNTPIDLSVHPNHFKKQDERKLWALNDFKAGDITDGLMEMHIGARTIQRVYKKLGACTLVTQYKHSPKEFKRDMRKLARDLEKAGV